MKAATRQVDEKAILDSIFTFFVNSGLENVSIRELTKGTRLAQGSLYYWFGDKTNMIMLRETILCPVLKQQRQEMEMLRKWVHGE